MGGLILLHSYLKIVFLIIPLNLNEGPLYPPLQASPLRATWKTMKEQTKKSNILCRCLFGGVLVYGPAARAAEPWKNKWEYWMWFGALSCFRLLFHVSAARAAQQWKNKWDLCDAFWRTTVDLRDLAHGSFVLRAAELWKNTLEVKRNTMLFHICSCSFIVLQRALQNSERTNETNASAKTCYFFKLFFHCSAGRS